MGGRTAELLRIARFGAVGLAATAAHSVVYTALAEGAGAPALFANVIAFALAFALSFYGQSRFTFGKQPERSRVVRFLATSLLGLLLNSVFVAVIVTGLGFRPAAAVPFFLFVTPAVTYVTLRFWVFR